MFPCTDATVGATQWLVYANTGSGFATTSTSFALPQVAESLSTFSGSNSGPHGGTGCAGSIQTWSAVDLRGDGKVDLVLTSSCTDTAVGTAAWSVYPGVCSP